MGFWGPGLYENDTAADVKDRVTTCWQEGMSGEEIISRIQEEFSDLTEEASPDGAFFWLGLADSLWRLGLLTEEIRGRAMAWLDQDWVYDSIPDQPLCPPMGKRRTTMLAKLKERLSSPQPKPRKYKKRGPRSCGWKMYDTYACPIRYEAAAELGSTDRWLLIRMIDEGLWEKTLVPIVYVKITKDTRLPASEEEYDALEYIQVGFTRYEDRFLPLDFSRLEEDIAEKAKLHYEVDEYGYLPRYMVILLQMTKKALQTELTYVGNYPNAAPPSLEFCPAYAGNNMVARWKNHGSVFTETMVARYMSFNLRRSKAYREPNSLERGGSMIAPLLPVIQKSLSMTQSELYELIYGEKGTSDT